ncbi:universal stress protein [Geobacter sulfurreducens]|uniref:universal stress protein n=1 Tax=Geobacter sulfurreducens TaxID=35554 RepID=UPI000DBB1444|nr:universal stress protein [Geobacter sulfurreducens]QVW36344.1 universal stress protein [Geobacter sulfurreducens]BBA69646.1 Putative universal stress protein [Geobacter sulfurreducens]
MKPFSTIVFPTDFSENSEYAFDYALTLAKQFNARLVVIHVINEPVDLRGFYVPHVSFEKLEEEIVAAAEKMMDKFCRTKIKDHENYSSCIVSGIPYDEVLKKATEEDASLIVMGTHGRKGIDHFLFGSTAERVVRNAKCPVMTVRPPEV